MAWVTEKLRRGHFISSRKGECGS
ncbi:hypothetical protein MTR67_023438 [Solanum verrucosum]|uniref:Uncharacterized protein n=1 Tax=Solanum verrucosum TaxID=315347 RepID=A0AAF0TYM1_SOLVR|nr:hypothetical protein MTR67_023438 [Solanum verrucosum]